MSVHTPVRPVTTPEDMTELMTAAVTPEAAIADPPLCVPSAAGLLLALLLLSPGKPK